jgi:hypothetical protein
MISTAVSIVFALSIGVITLVTIRANGNPSQLTVRGKRVVFALAFVGGLALYQIATHLYWTGTGYTWL